MKVLPLLLSLPLALACGHTAPQRDGQQYVCYPVDGSAQAPLDASDSCQAKAPPGCVLTDLSHTDPGGTSAWCCADVAKNVLLCCSQP